MIRVDIRVLQTESNEAHRRYKICPVGLCDHFEKPD
jgi:hypothetical protein